MRKEYGFSKLKGRTNPYAKRLKKQKSICIDTAKNDLGAITVFYRGMRSSITAFKVVLAAIAFALACNVKNVQEVPTRKPNEALESRLTHNKRKHDPTVSAKVQSEVVEIPAKQESKPAAAVPIETEPTSDREDSPETENSASNDERCKTVTEQEIRTMARKKMAEESTSIEGFGETVTMENGRWVVEYFRVRPSVMGGGYQVHFEFPCGGYIETYGTQ